MERMTKATANTSNSIQLNSIIKADADSAQRRTRPTAAMKLVVLLGEETLDVPLPPRRPSAATLPRPSVTVAGLTLALARDGGGIPTTTTPMVPSQETTTDASDDDATTAAAACTFPSCLHFSKAVCARNSRGDVIFFYNYCDLLVRNCRDHDGKERV